MAFTSLTRLLWNRRRQLPETTTFIAPPLFDLDLQFQNRLSLTDVANQDDINLLFLGCLPEQGSSTLEIPGLPLRLDTSTLRDLENYVRRLPGFVRFVLKCHNNTFTFVVDFTTAAEATMALATRPTIDLGDDGRRRFQRADIDHPEPSRKRIKTTGELEVDPMPPLPHCQACCDEIKGPFVRPCLYCRQAWCYDCIKSDFEACLKDVDRFPARCCGRLKHYDVARGIIPKEMYINYKTRFEELSTTRPVYCANMRCSTFLSSRVCPPDEKGLIRCSDCENLTCKECRVVVEDIEEHECASPDEVTTLLKQFDYKCCPRCNIAVARMYGCPHMRCRCGAHFCWDCVRPINVCWRSPCAQAREDMGDYPEDEAENGEGEEMYPSTNQEPVTEFTPAAAINSGEVSTEPQRDNTNNANPDPPEPAPLPNAQQPTESTVIPDQRRTSSVNDSEQGQQPIHENITSPSPTDEPERRLPFLPDLFDAFHHVANPTFFETPPDAPPHTPVVEPQLPTVNLDFGYDWEEQDLDFGDEPTDEPWNTWGCPHKHTLVQASSCNDWVPVMTSDVTGRLERHIECMRCFETVIFDEKTEVQKQGVEGGETITTDTNETVPKQSATANPSKESKERKTHKKKSASEIPKLFQCQKCGVFHCLDCKKIVTKDVTRVRLDRR